MTVETDLTYQYSKIKPILISQLLGTPAAYFLTTYFSNLYSGLLQFIFLSLLFQLVCGLVVSLFLQDVFGKLRKSWRDNWTSLLILVTTGTLAVLAIVISWQYPQFFDRRVVSMEATLFPFFAGLAVIAATGAIPLNKFLEQKGVIQFIRSSTHAQFMWSNLAGLFNALFFFFTYFIFSQSLNFYEYNTLDRFFDTDASQWISRLTLHPDGGMPPIRGIHPAVMLILRPFVWLISIILNGDKLQAVYFLSAVAGALCVFLVWLIVKAKTGNTTFALVIASILGTSASHLLLSSMLETYIFSALALITFCFFMVSDKTSLKFTIPVGIVIFGITVTNLAQACIMYFLKIPRLKVMIQFILAVVATTLLLNSLQVQLFPKARPLYTPSSLTFEQRYRFDLFKTSWRLTGRVNLISRAILLYGIVAPNPYILMEELGSDVPNFRTFQIANNAFHVAGYKGFSDIAVKFWIAIIGLAIILFITNFTKTSKKDNSFAISLILCMAFNFGLHVLYGDDPMLYSPDWVYALVLFVSSSLGKWADRRWIQLGLIIFLGMIMYTNLRLIHQIMEVSLPFYGN